MAQTLLPTSLVGSYPQPEWLIDRQKLAGRFPPRVRAKELWRVAPEYLEQAQGDATLLAIRDQERAGLDIITDGEMRRESYSNRFATALEGVDIDNPGTALDRSSAALQGRDLIRRVLADADKEATIFAGHYHMDVVTTEGRLTQVISPAVSYQIEPRTGETDTSTFGYRVIEFGPDGLASRIVTFRR